MNTDSKKDTAYLKEKIAFAKLMITRNRILSIGIIMLLIAVIYLTLFVTSYPAHYFLTFTVIGSVYIGLYYLFPKNVLIVLIFTSLFYVVHTYYELSIGLDFTYFEKYIGNGRGNNMGNTIINAIIKAYPIIRYAMVAVFLFGFIPYFQMLRNPEIFRKWLKEGMPASKRVSS